MKIKRMAVTMAVSLVMVGIASAGTVHRGRIEKRDARQQKRIAQGVNSGQLTPRETAVLEKKEAKLQKQEAHVRADGTVTKQERHRIAKKQSNLSKQIYRQKHDKQTTGN
jgi:hypothetical protein